MKRILPLLLAAFVAHAARAAEPSYDDIVRMHQKYQAVLEEEGLGYMVGGAIGLVSSLVLGIRSEEVVPKIGYSLIQVLSAASISHGAQLYYVGDGFTAAVEVLQGQEAVLRRVPGMNPSMRTAVMNANTRQLMSRERTRRSDVRRLRGWLEIATAASAGTSLAFSKVHTTSSNLILGFVALVSLSGGLSDLVFANDDSFLRSLNVSAAPTVGDGGAAGLVASLSLRF